jgi:monoamine oxidase
LSRERIIDAALHSLGGMLDRSPRSFAHLVTDALIHNWVTDPLARGAYSYERVHAGSARSILASPLNDTLIFAGEATDTSGQASTVAGALASGRRAALEVLSSIRRLRGPAIADRHIRGFTKNRMCQPS